MDTPSQHEDRMVRIEGDAGRAHSRINNARTDIGHMAGRLDGHAIHIVALWVALIAVGVKALFF